MRALAYILGWIVGGVLLIALLIWGWVEWSKEQVRKFRASKIADIQDSQRGRRPMWTSRIEPRTKEKPRVQ